MNRWLPLAAVRAMHDELIAEHGGAAGLRDPAALDAACARAQQLAAHGDDASSFQLAAAYGHGIARSHPFVDGNKRTVLMAMYVFLRLNGRRLIAPETETVAVVQDLAAGLLSESDLAQWLQMQAEPVP